MHDRRKNDSPKAYAPDGSHLKVDQIYWQAVAERDKVTLCNFSFFDLPARDVMQFRFLNEDIRIDLTRCCLLRSSGGQWEKCDDPLLTLATVMYLKNVNAVDPIGKDIVSA